MLSNHGFLSFFKTKNWERKVRTLDSKLTLLIILFFKEFKGEVKKDLSKIAYDSRLAIPIHHIFSFQNTEMCSLCVKGQFRLRSNILTGYVILEICVWNPQYARYGECARTFKSGVPDAKSKRCKAYPKRINLTV